MVLFLNLLKIKGSNQQTLNFRKMKYLFTILLAGMTLFTYAQKSNGKMMGHKDFTPQQMAELQTKKMTLALDLSPAQQSKIMALNQKMAVERTARMQKHKSMRGSGNTMTSEERFKMQNEMLDIQIKNQAEMKKILNKDQYEQWKNFRNKKINKMKKHAHRSKNKPMRSRG
ncbi:MAG: hypothetical protein DSY82_07855 [Flavobacteriia bacterium]|nr:MAG: hypothetical protein DSY82_07855 [Flavobacteriia bacterium]